MTGFLVSDDPARAAAEFPGATVLRQAAAVADLPAGTPVSVVVYRLRPISALDAARILIGAGVLKEGPLKERGD